MPNMTTRPDRLAGLALPVLLLACGANHAAARDAAQDEREIRAVAARICRAFQDGDADALRPLLDERFTLTSSNGEVTSLAQNLREVRARDPAYDVFRNHDQRVHLYGDAAIVIGITTVTGRSGGDAFAADFRFTDTWVYRDGHWTLAASHASRLPGH
jgi:ketosteroid isomerase-like protein